MQLRQRNTEVEQIDEEEGSLNPAIFLNESGN